MKTKLIDEAFEFIRQLSEWTTNYEDEWEPTGDDYIDNTMSDLSEMIKKARDITKAHLQG